MVLRNKKKSQAPPNGDRRSPDNLRPAAFLLGKGRRSDSNGRPLDLAAENGSTGVIGDGLLSKEIHVGMESPERHLTGPECPRSLEKTLNREKGHTLPGKCRH